MSEPLISVVLPVYFGERYLRESVESILTQTYKHFEFIIFDDGSKDNSRKILESYDDSRIRLIFQENAGLPETLNRAIALCRGRYIARQDHDDISLPSRLQKQLDFLEANPSFAMVGTGADIWAEDQISHRQHDHPSDCATLQFELLFNNPFVHSSLMFRSEVFQKVGLYSTDPARQPPEDYEFISRIARHYPIANLNERLVIYRETSNSMSSVIRPDAVEKNNLFKDRLALISAENIEYENTGNLLPSGIAIEFGKIVHSCKHENAASKVPYTMLLTYLVKAFIHIFTNTPDNDAVKLLEKRIHQTYIQYCLYKRPDLLNSSPESGPSHIGRAGRVITRIIYKVRIRIMPIAYIMFARGLLSRFSQNRDPQS